MDFNNKVDKQTQIEANDVDLFDFEFEVKPILEMLVKKILLSA